jgi:antitoxin VapB
MPLNIKSAKAYELARRVAQATGESLTEAVAIALEERLTRIDPSPDALAEEILALGRDCAGRLEEPWRSLDHAELLYDDKGLPR